MRHLSILLAGWCALAAIACASSNNNPPAASSASIAQPTNEPNQGPDFAPASSVGLAAAPGGTWASGAERSSGLNPATGNAAAAPEDHSKQATSDADNTRVPRRDRSGSTPTLMDQGPSDADRKRTRDIRQAVMNDSSLSFTAKNVKIITVGGRVTLRGPVKTEAERTAVEAAARKVVGNGSLVESQLQLIQ